MVSTRWVLFFVAAACVSMAETQSMSETFDGKWTGWEPLAEGHWETAATNGRPVLHLVENAEQRPPVRRPGMYILSPDGVVSNVVITSKVLTLRPPEVKNRDVCILFGYQDDTHFYYAHISSASDDRVHNVIMRVDGDKRTRINIESMPEPLLEDGWQTVSVQHMASGEIKVWVDGKLNMTAQDTTYPSGRVGLGSFDDPAMFADFSIQPARRFAAVVLRQSQ
ncbi:MAG TPA: hypothetical protein VJ904_14575 [Tichowtungia sp.]|nr:hypothetical protein [Tichowtungia sp.]